jgi:hypothetical protein
VEPKLNGTHRLLGYADDVNLLGDNVETVNRTETSVDASKEVGLEVSVKSTKYMLVSCEQNAGQNWDMKIANTTFENVSQFKDRLCGIVVRVAGC